MATVTARVQQGSWAQDLWADFQRAITDMALKLRVDAWSCSLELCTRTLEADGAVRLHGHAFLMKEASKMTVRNPRMLVWRSSMPNKREQLAGIRNRNSGSWSAMYYLQCAKVGLVFTAGNKQPFADYPVNGSWIFTSAQAGKLLYPAARSELVRTTQGLTRKLADLEALAS